MESSTPRLVVVMGGNPSFLSFELGTNDGGISTPSNENEISAPSWVVDFVPFVHAPPVEDHASDGLYWT